MKLIEKNPYRIIGVFANATTRELQGRRGKIQAFAKVGKAVDSEYDFNFFQPVNRNEETIRTAFSQIEQNQDKVKHALFWFVNANPIDATAIQHLVNGNREKALEIWEKVTDDGEKLTDNNFSSFSNLGTLNLLSEHQSDIIEAIHLKTKFLSSLFLQNFIELVADKTVVVDSKKQTQQFVDNLLGEFGDIYSYSDIFQLFSRSNTTTIEYLGEKFTSEPIHKIEKLLESTEKKRRKDKWDAYQFGMDLYNDGKDEIKVLKDILGPNNLQYKMLVDNVAKELLQCSIDYVNESQEQDKSNNYLEEGLELIKLASPIAVNSATQDKIKDSILTLEKMKDRELSQAIQVLTSVKEAYEDNKRRIHEQVAIQKSELGYGQSINWSKVSEAIENSIAWDKVVELIKEAIPPRNVEKIKLAVSNLSDIDEYKSLVEFLLSKLKLSQKAQVKYLCYWETVNATSTISSGYRSTHGYKPKYEYPPETSSSNSNRSIRIPKWLIWTSIIGVLLLIIGLIWGEMGVVFAIFGLLILGVGSLRSL